MKIYTTKELKAAGYVRNSDGGFGPSPELLEAHRLLQELLIKNPKQLCKSLYEGFNPHDLDQCKGTREATQLTMLLSRITGDKKWYAMNCYHVWLAYQTIETAGLALKALDAAEDSGVDTIYGRCNSRIWIAEWAIKSGYKRFARRLVLEAFDYLAKHPEYDLADGNVWDWDGPKLLAKLAEDVPAHWLNINFRSRTAMRQWAEEYRRWRRTASAKGGAR